MRVSFRLPPSSSSRKITLNLALDLARTSSGGWLFVYAIAGTIRDPLNDQGIGKLMIVSTCLFIAVSYPASSSHSRSVDLPTDIRFRFLLTRVTHQLGGELIRQEGEARCSNVETATDETVVPFVFFDFRPGVWVATGELYPQRTRSKSTFILSSSLPLSNPTSSPVSRFFLLHQCKVCRSRRTGFGTFSSLSSLP